MNDDVLTRVADQFSQVEMKVSIEQIYARAQTIRTRRRRTAAVAAGAVAAVAAGLTIVAVIPGGAHPSPPATPQLAAFSISAGPNGTSALTLRKGQQYRLDPVALRQALAEHNIPALVTVGQNCDTTPEPAGLDQVVRAERQSDDSVTLTIDPAALPPSAEVSIGYYPTRTTFSLIQEGAALHCTQATSPASGSASGIQTRSS
jgi:hypothetical protein